MSTRRRLVAVLAVVGVLAVGGAAWAYFTSSGSGTGAANVGTLAAPTHVTGTPTGSTVAVSWTGVTDPGSGTFGYYVTRTPYPSGTTVNVCGSSPTALLSGTSCNDTSVPSGNYTYTVTSVYNSWTNSASSSEVTVVSTPPSASAPGVSAIVNYGTNPYWVNKENVTLTDTPSTNGGSAIASVSYYDCATAVAPCTSSNWTPIGSGSVGPNWSSTWNGTSLPADGTYDVVAIATNSGSISSTTSSATEAGIDTTAPVTTDNTGSIGNAWKNTTQTVTLSPTDTGSGDAQTYYTTDGSTPSEIGGVPQGSTKTGTSIVLNTSGQYTIKYFSIDDVGNVEAVKTAGTVIRIDVIAPVVPVPTVNGH
jgi:hypothetical protein